MGRAMRACALAFASLAILLAGPASMAVADPPTVLPVTSSYDATFSTTGQSLWGAGGGIQAGIDKPYMLIDETWDSSSSKRDVQTLVGQSFGGGVSATASGDIGLGAHFRDFSGGQVSVNYPVRVSLTSPAPRSFKAGQTVRIGSSWQLLPGASLQSAPLPGRIDLIGHFKMHDDATAEICIFSCTSFPFFPPIDVAEIKDTIFTSDDIPQGNIPFIVSSRTGVTGSFHVPNVALTTTVGSDGKTLVASGTQDFIDLIAHMDKWATMVAGLPPLEAGGSYGGASGGYNIFGAAINLAMRQAETLTFTPTIRVTLDLPAAVAYTVRDGAGNALSSGISAHITYDAGNSLDLTFPATFTGSLNVSPTFSLTNSFDHTATTTFSQDITFSSLSLTLVIPSVQVTPAVHIPGTPDVYVPEVVITPAFYVPEVVITPAFDTPFFCVYYWVPTPAWDDPFDGYWACISGTEVPAHHVPAVVTPGYWVPAVVTPAYTIPGIPPIDIPALNSPRIDLGTIGPVWQKTVQRFSTTDTSLFDGDRPAWSLGGFGNTQGAAFNLEPNRPPMALITGNAPAAEGDLVTLSGATSSDPDGDALTAYAWSFGDGTTATGVSATHVYADNGTYTIQLTVTDAYGLTNTASSSIAVSNVAPTVNAGANRTGILEGALVSPPAATFNDKGTRDTHSAKVDWGDGSPIAPAPVAETPFGPPGATAGLNGTVALGTHVYANEGTYTVKVCVTDDDGAATCSSFTATVANVPPTLNVGADQMLDEGSVISLTSRFNDRGTLDRHTATVTWGDGTATEIATVDESPFGPPGSTSGANGAVRATHVYADDGIFIVTVCVSDNVAAAVCETFTVTVLATTPTVRAGDPRTVGEGSTVDLATTFHAKGTLGFHTATVDWGDGTGAGPATVIETPTGPAGSTAGLDGSVSGSHIYADNGSYTVKVCVNDDDDALACDTFVATVLNVPPTAKLQGGPLTAYWARPIDFTADITDPSPIDTAAGFDNRWSWGDGTPNTTDHSLTPAKATHTYANAGPYTLTFDATDKDGGNDARSTDGKAITIIRRPSTISCAAADTTFGYTSALTSQLVDGIHAPTARFAARLVTFTTGAYSWTATTDAAGKATSQTPTQSRTTAGPSPLTPGTQTVTVAFAGDVNYDASTATCTFKVGNTLGTVHSETKQKTATGSTHLQAEVRDTIKRGPSGEVEFERSGRPDIELHAKTITGIGIASDARSAWISGNLTDGRAFVIYTEDNSVPEGKGDNKSNTPRNPDVGQIWIAGVLQNGDGLSLNGDVHIRLGSPSDKDD